ncbi:hypothetical protein PVAND_003355 [Polypedilum vanderplanki]|uniref:A-kinase anchor protein 2 C-terminal domain-containing protein n=1 Tax=Polypedilum vanderplanki TaxID=319348 RepID=A0A9J6BTS9_POLVA|nr:hypothetical protein PVAND_003355 [Polypedilum vanderplanki]
MRPVEQEPSSDCLLRIQNEISEVEKREMELKKEHAMLSPRMSVENDDIIEPPQESLNDETRNSSFNQHESEDDTRFLTPPPPVNVCMKDNFKKNKIIEPQPKPQLLVAPALTRALSQPQLFNISPVKIGSPHRGIMQKFIASRGKLNVNQVTNQPIQNGNGTNNNFKKNLIMAPIEFNSDSIKALQNLDKTQIERDTKGRPIRKGYIPVEEKIQSELRDLKNRETELKRLHKLNVRYSEDELSSDETDEAEWSPINGKLSRSIDVLNETNLESSSKPIPVPRVGNGIRPAVSLAALCDLDDAETPPSSHKLIERWEHIIQVNQQREKSYNIH